MNKREVKGLNQTGRVSIKRTQAASALIQKSAAKSGARPRGGDTLVTVGRTATGRNVVAFRVGGDHRPDTKYTTAAELRAVSRTRD